MFAYPLYPNRNTRSLDGIWDFAWLGADAPSLEKITTADIVCSERMPVPGCFDAPPKYAGLRGAALYRTLVDFPAHKRFRIKLYGLGLRGLILWDGHTIGVDELPYSVMEFEWESGANEHHTLEILIDNRFNMKETPLFQPYFDFYAYGGIYRSVEIEELPEQNRFGRVAIETLNCESGTIRLRGRLSGPHDAISYSIDGSPEQPIRPAFNGESFDTELTVPGLRPWSLQEPVLHCLTLRCGDDAIIERFGLRTFRCEKGKFLLNGKEIRLAGYNRHDVHPQFGPSTNDAVQLEDLQILRDLGCNFIRGCHYPQSQRFLDRCDELGFLVWEESLGWGDNEEVQHDKKFRELQIVQTRNMIRHSINHPSVVIWGVMNECGDDREVGDSLLREQAKAMREEDSTRPVTYASMRPFNSISLDAFDIISINKYPGWYVDGGNLTEPRPLADIPQVLQKIEEKFSAPEWREKPLILSEIGAGAIYGWRDRIRGFWSEEYQADVLQTICQWVKTHPRVSGLALWLFADSRTYSAAAVLGRPRAFNNKGLVDEYRRPKLAYDTVKKYMPEIIGGK